MAPHYLHFERANGNLILTLTEEGRADLDDLVAKHGGDVEAVLWDLMEHQLANGWTALQPSDIGALTTCPVILTEEAEYNDDGSALAYVGRVYWHRNYMLDDPIELLRGPGLHLSGAHSTDNDD